MGTGEKEREQLVRKGREVSKLHEKYASRVRGTALGSVKNPFCLGNQTVEDNAAFTNKSLAFHTGGGGEGIFHSQLRKKK